MGELLVCPECAYEWNPNEAEVGADAPRVIKDSAGNILADGDDVTIIKDMKVKGSSTPLKVGTKSPQYSPRGWSRRSRHRCKG